MCLHNASIGDKARQHVANPYTSMLNLQYREHSASTLCSVSVYLQGFADSRGACCFHIRHIYRVAQIKIPLR